MAQAGQITFKDGVYSVADAQGSNPKAIDFKGGAAGPGRMQDAMLAAGESIAAQQFAMSTLMNDGISAADVAQLNEYNNNISLLSSAQKSLNNAQGAAQKMIAA